MNPSRGKVSDYRPAQVTVAILVYVPHLTGYFEHRMEVVQLCLTSVLENTHTPVDLLIFNNGSCAEIRTYLDALYEQGKIDYLLHSQRNIGKIGAFQVLFHAAPGEYVAYADDDIFFFPGWLKAHLKILKTYPRVGMLSGCAVRTLFNQERISSNLEFAKATEGVRVSTDRRIPDRWMQEWANSYGRDWSQIAHETKDVEDIVLEYQGVQAFAMANHNQFLAPKKVILECLPKEWSGRLMGEMNELDIAINQAGYLRLSTIGRSSAHIGNVVGSWLKQYLPQDWGVEREWAVSSISRPSRLWRSILMWRPIRWFLLGLYSRLFRWINPEEY
jgi:glycosyltransferase involved in cell wall biosynthesis